MIMASLRVNLLILPDIRFPGQSFLVFMTDFQSRPAWQGGSASRTTRATRLRFQSPLAGPHIEKRRPSVPGDQSDFTRIGRCWQQPSASGYPPVAQGTVHSSENAHSVREKMCKARVGIGFLRLVLTDRKVLRSQPPVPDGRLAGLTIRDLDFNEIVGVQSSP
jgi:hypothetical protein